MLEKQWEAKVREIAKLYQWVSPETGESLVYHTHDSRRSDGGFPDLVLCKPKAGRVVFAELKSQTGRMEPKQRDWLEGLAACGMEVALWRPEDLTTVIRVLSGKERAVLKLPPLRT